MTPRPKSVNYTHTRTPDANVHISLDSQVARQSQQFETTPSSIPNQFLSLFLISIIMLPSPSYWSFKPKKSSLILLRPSHSLLPSPKTISTMSFNVLSIPTAKPLTRPVLALVESSTIASLVVYSPSFFPLQSQKVHFPIKIPNHPISLFKSL